MTQLRIMTCTLIAPTGVVESETSTMDFANIREARAVFERRFLCNALRRHNGVIAQVAEAIGMSRRNLYIKLETLDIDYDRYRKCS